MKISTIWENPVIRIIVQTDIRPFTKNGIIWRKRLRGCPDPIDSLDDYRSKFNKALRLAKRAWIAAGKPVAPPGRQRLDVHVVRSSGRDLDEANIWWGLAGFIDGLFCDAITADDSPEFLHLGEITQESDPKFLQREFIRFTIAPMESSLWHENGS